ncbi:MAG: ABC transporter permease [Candidatus Eiseniibacteriota bacterium]
MFQFSLSRMLAVAERDLRRFRRNGVLMIPMALMPMIYLVILGKAMGGDLHDLPLAIVDQDGGPAAVTVHDRLQTLQQGRDLLRISDEPDAHTAINRLREGDYVAVVIIPPSFSEDASRGEPANLGVVVDNTDNTSANVIEGELRRAFAGVVPGGAATTVTNAAGQPMVSGLTSAPGINVQRVDVYGHKEFIQYLVPGVIALALFFVAMLAGGIILVDDRARGIHEGYFVTPLSTLDLMGGLTLSAVTLAMIIGNVVLASSILIARLQIIGGLRTILLTEVSILLLAFGLILFMFTLMARVSNPMTPRALFGILNVLTFFPSGALYPVESYPPWLQAISAAFPMRYAVHSLRGLLLKGVGPQAVASDFLLMGVFALVMLVLGALSFKRTL